jgi:hypothetical protein
MGLKRVGAPLEPNVRLHEKAVATSYLLTRRQYFLGQPAAIQLDMLALTRLLARWADSAIPVGGSCLLD